MHFFYIEVVYYSLSTWQLRYLVHHNLPHHLLPAESYLASHPFDPKRALPQLMFTIILLQPPILNSSGKSHWLQSNWKRCQERSKQSGFMPRSLELPPQSTSAAFFERRGNFWSGSNASESDLAHHHHRQYKVPCSLYIQPYKWFTELQFALVLHWPVD